MCFITSRVKVELFLSSPWSQKGFDLVNSQPAVGDPASAGGLDQMTHRGPFQPRPFCGSVFVVE